MTGVGEHMIKLCLSVFCISLHWSEVAVEGPPHTAESTLPAQKTYDATGELKVIGVEHSNREAGRRFHVGESKVGVWKKLYNYTCTLPYLCTGAMCGHTLKPTNN